MGSFTISRRSNSEYQFTLRANNNETILSSEGYPAKSDCHHGIESVRLNAADEARYDRRTASNGQYYFNLSATNGEVIGSSEMYDSTAARDKGIAAVKENAAGATIDDQSA